MVLNTRGWDLASLLVCVSHTRRRVPCTLLHTCCPRRRVQLASAIADAIRDAGLNLNPAVEGNIVRVPVPKASKETRDATIKLVSKIAENAKTRIRHVRQAALDKLKKVEGTPTPRNAHHDTPTLCAQA
ncbi:ribosome-recycling factor [archaeon]|nr:MAG: ribosome-recycling factor [archaeon]